MSEKLCAYFKISDLIITNPNLDLYKIKSLTDKLRSGELSPHEIEPISLRISLGQGIFVIDGSHGVVAFRLAKIPRISGKSFSLRRPINKASLKTLAS